MIDFYIHQIGNIQHEKTYERLISILKSQTISSRDFLEKQGIKFENDNTSFKFDVPDEKNGCIMKRIFIKIGCHYQILKIDLLKNQLREKIIKLLHVLTMIILPSLFLGMYH